MRRSEDSHKPPGPRKPSLIQLHVVSSTAFAACLSSNQWLTPDPGASYQDYQITTASSSVGASQRTFNFSVLCSQVEQIAGIHDSFPHLTHLGLDTDHNGTWPNTTLDALVANPRLKSLSLGPRNWLRSAPRRSRRVRFQSSGLNGVGLLREPRMSLNMSEELFSYLREKKHGGELKQLNIAIGDYSEVPHSGPLFLPD